MPALIYFQVQIDKPIHDNSIIIAVNSLKNAFIDSLIPYSHFYKQ